MKIKTLTYYLIFILGFLIPNYSLSLETLGGELTWRCSGNSSYVFELVLYRDCNENDITTTSETIRVWNHGVLTDFPVNLRTTVEIVAESEPANPVIELVIVGVELPNGFDLSSAVIEIVFGSTSKL